MNDVARNSNKLIYHIKSGRLCKEILPNSSAEFTGNGENRTEKRYNLYLASLSCDINNAFIKEDKYYGI